MSYFPAYLKIDDKKILIVGGGKIAFEKLTHLLDFTHEITLLSKDFCDEIKNRAKTNNLKTVQKEYEKGDIADYDIIIIAVDDINLQNSIYQESKGSDKLCNAVDSVEFCDFIFPSYIKKGDLIISVSTSGSSPAVAKYLRRYIQKIIPDDMDIFLRKLKHLRGVYPKGKARMKFFDEMVKRYFKSIS